MGSVNKTERIEIIFTGEDFKKLSKEDQAFSHETGDISQVLALVAKEHGYRIVEWPPQGSLRKVCTVVKL